MKIAMFVYPLLLAMTASAHAQSDDAARKQLQQAATGPTFRIGYSEFRLVPDSVVSRTQAKKTADAREVRVGAYAVQSKAAKTGAVAKTAAPKTKLAAAMSDDGRPVVVTSTLEVYHSNVAVLQDAARVSGGTLVYSSNAGGNGRIEFDSVAAAMAAIPKIQALAGVKEVSPEIIQGEDQMN